MERDCKQTPTVSRTTEIILSMIEKTSAVTFTKNKRQGEKTLTYQHLLSVNN